ncbi:hypothetical protein [Candidatus Uabimicrobium sp. HlEnr_7]|uniref:hypothetical protein n=1 Tax=Candidatus Uabimicrobium helgolandensis TaxID=3095367 RepID=UPI0035588EC3
MTIFTKNKLKDSQLQGVDYKLKEISSELEYIKNSAFWHEQERPIIIVGNDNWLTHYLLHFFTEYQHNTSIVFIGFSIPNFLEDQRYKSIIFIKIMDIHQIKNLLIDYTPQTVFYSDYARDIRESDFITLYTKNVLQVEKICQTLSSLPSCRLILFSDSSVYSKGATLEDNATKPIIPLAKSFEEMEQVSISYHKPQELEIYCLRVAPVYGICVNDGLMQLVYLFASGYILGTIDNIDNIPTVHATDVITAAFLIMIAPKPGYQIFNISDNSVSLHTFLRLLDRNLPKTKLLGIDCKLANILGFGYQGQIPVSQTTFKYLSHFFEYSNDFINQLRFPQKKSALNENIADYMLSLSVITSKRLKNTLGWAPDNNIENTIIPILDWHQKNDWHNFETSHTYDEYTKNVLLPVYDNATQIAEELSKYMQSVEKVNKYIHIQILDLPKMHIDIQSLYIFFQEIWNNIPSIVGKSGKKQFIPELFPEILQTIVQILRYEYSVVERQFPEDKSKQIFNLTQKLGEFSPKTMRFYCHFAILSKAFIWMNKHMGVCRELLQIIPDKNIGILVQSDLGDIAIRIKIKNQKIIIDSFRKDVDSFPRSWTLEKKLQEFKKSANSYLTLGFYLKTMIRDAFASDFIKRGLYNLGKCYFIQELEKKYIDALIEKISHESMNTYYLFIDNKPQAKLGFAITHKKITKANSSFLAMINELMKTTDDLEQLSQLLELQASKREKYVFLRIRTVRKLLSSKFSTMLLKWLLGNSK